MRFASRTEELDTEEITRSNFINRDYFKNSTFLITGATGLIGAQIIKTLLFMNENCNSNVNIIALVRNIKKAKKIFDKNKTNKLHFVVQDINKEIKYNKKVDFIIHCANSTSSKSFVTEPVETIKSIVDGTKNVLDFAKKKKTKSVVYLSSMEVYGQTDFSKTESLNENELGYIDLTQARSSYPEGKRLAENLCLAYAKEYNVPVKTARLVQTIGAGVDYNDNRVFAQFARNIVENKDIVLHTTGETTRSYCYITDAIIAFFVLLERGENGECYNISNEATACSIKDMAQMLCDKYKTSNLIIDLENENSRYYLPTIKTVLSSKKLQNLNWEAKINLEVMFEKLITSFNSKEERKQKFAEKIFSIKNRENYKIITVLGLKFNLDLKKINQKFIENSRKKFGINPKKIVFSNYMGNAYGCNSKYITEELLKRNTDLEIVWIVKDNIDKKEFPPQIKIVSYSKKEALKELATAKFWVDNYHKNYFINKGLTKDEKQVYIQTWHGSLGIKKIEKCVDNLTQNVNWENNAILNSQYTDYWISNSTFETNVYKESFWDVKNIKEFGHPRNDIFFVNDEKIKEKVYNKLGIDKDTKVILHVPSFRDNENTEVYNIDYDKVVESLKEKYGSNWVFVLRLHPRVQSKAEGLLKGNKNVINATFYPDIQELLYASEMIITDYSSCIFDFMLTRKPAYIYAPDIALYNTERGFCYPLESTPFPIAKNNEELINNIKSFDCEKYVQRVEEFLQDKGCVDDGNASKRVVDLILENI